MLKGDTGAKRTWFYENGAFVAAALAAVLWHVVLSTNVGDDMVYFKTLLDGNSSLSEILAHRYETWSSRMVIEAVLIPLVHCPLLWKILDIVIFTSLPVLLCGLLGVTGRGRWFVTGLVLLYPFADMASAGWIATTTNYLWPLWGVLVIGMVLKQLRCGRKVPVWEVAAALLACAYAGSQEQAAVLLLLLFGMEVLHYISEKCMKQPLLYALCGIDIISLVYILSCPGNAIRSAQEMAGRMPEFADFTFAEKLYMGLANVERIFIAELDPVYCVVAAVLVLLVYRKTGDYRKTLLAGIPALLLFGQAVVREKVVRATGTDDTLGLACSGNLYAAGISGTVCLGDSIRPVAAGGRRVEALPVDGVFTGRRFCHGGGHGIFTDNLRIGKPAVPLSVFCADLCVRGCRVEHGRHEGCLEDRQFGCCAENAGAGKTDVYRTRASGAGKHSGCDPDVLAAWKASVIVYNRNPLFHAGNLTKNPISADVYHMNGFSQGYIQGGMWIWESALMHREV